MRFTTLILAAGYTVISFSAPVAPNHLANSTRHNETKHGDCPMSLPETNLTSTPIAAIQSTNAAVTASLVVPAVAAVSAIGTPKSSVATTSIASSSSIITKSITTATNGITSSSTVSSATASGTANLQWFGANESGAEFGSGNIPGTLGTDYTWPNTSAIDILMADGMNIFRIPILMERLVPTSMTSTIDTTYLSGLQTVVNHITNNSGHAIIDSQNFGRYDGNIFISTSDFETYWKTVATEFATNTNVIFDCNNEFHDEPSNDLVAELNQACITGIRSAGATTQYIFVEGTSYTGAWTWVSSGNSISMLNITDPSDKIVYEMHQYLDSDGSGTSSTCVNNTIGADRIAEATQWLKTNGKKGIIGEFAGGANSVCMEAIQGMLGAMGEASDVWLGALWWGAGPWWGDYIFGMEPSEGVAYEYYIDTLKTYM